MLWTNLALSLGFFSQLDKVLAQGPGGGQVNNPPVEMSGSVLGATQSTAGAQPTGDYGPWSDDSHLQGTWSSKSGMVITGPDFYDPVDELLIEPALPGISYSFYNGFYEEAIYQVTGNPKDPKCATGVLIFQHGNYSIDSNGKLTLNPIEVDGRQLLSDPCNASSTESVYSRYSQTEQFSQFEVSVDMYYGRYRLDLYQFDGTPMAPMYLTYKPAQMLPTITMNPTSGASDSSGSATATAASTRQKVRRQLANRSKTKAVRQNKVSYDTVWWIGVSMMIAGGAGFMMLS